MRATKHLRNLLIASCIGIATGLSTNTVLHTFIDAGNTVAPLQSPVILLSSETALA